MAEQLSEYEIAKQDLIATYNSSGMLSLYAAFHYYNEKGYNKFKLDYDTFCDIFTEGINLPCYFTQTDQYGRLISVEKTIEKLVIYYNIKTTSDSNSKVIMSC